MNDRMRALGEKLADERGKRILFVAHCILNENSRYQGGAFRPGLNEGIVEQARRAGAGIVQMPCPEQRAWGGVQRPWMWLLLGRKGTLLYALRRPFLHLFVWYTKIIWRRIARDVVRVMSDFARSGYEIVGVVGIAGSPSCGVTRNLDLFRGAEYIAATSLETIVRERFNLEGIRAAVSAGQGWYFEALSNEMRRHRIAAPFFEDDLVAMLEGCPCPLDLGLAAAQRPSAGA